MTTVTPFTPRLGECENDQQYTEPDNEGILSWP